MAGQVELLEYVNLQDAEAAAEFDLLLGRDRLIAKDHDVVIQMRAVNTREIFVVKRAAEVQIENLGSKSSLERTNVE
ncbi:hypothetical protein GCM10009304_20000 [Pseudomonas matsuisoli]|uniref:Uncharacterized protein n=1 Tax=Pseudomonas matsuisoli TaxID=1515666 RepID=A0A917PV31_9PSED|nr:hypothetical protein GCM10009304_20000 [Pseudomonas matsuisoli]